MRIGIVQPLAGIGDMITHSSHIRAIVHHYRPNHTVLYCKTSTQAHHYGRQLLHVDQVSALPLPKRIIRPDQVDSDAPKTRHKLFQKLRNDISFRWRFYRMLRNDRLDAILILHHSPKYGFCAMLAGIKDRLGYGFDGQHRFLTQHFGLSRDRRLHDYYSLKCDFFLKTLGICQEPLLPKLTLNTQPAHPPLICIGIGASGVDKQWGSQHFQTLCQWLLEHTTFSLLLCGGPTDRIIADSIDRHCSQHADRVHSLCDLNVYEAFVQISQSQLYVGNDTGFLHAAAAFGKPTLGLFGSPYQAILDYSPLIHSCTPTIDANQSEPIRDDERILFISVDSVIQKLKPLLQTISIDSTESA